MIATGTWRRVHKSARDTWWSATGSLRALPDFIIIGAQKCGTSSLYQYLGRHPQILPARKKEIHFFDDRAYEKGLNWYRSHFPLVSEMRGGDVIAGEASPYYIVHPRCHQRVVEVLPEVKIIVMLRNPADRALSHYNHQRRKGREPLSFADALDAESDRLRGEEERILANDDYYSHNFWAYSYKTRGIYADQIQRWKTVFSADQFLFVISEEFFANPNASYQRVLEFLGLVPHKLDVYGKANAGTYDAMDPSIRKELNGFFRPHNARLRELIGCEPDW